MASDLIASSDRLVTQLPLSPTRLLPPLLPPVLPPLLTEERDMVLVVLEYDWWSVTIGLVPITSTTAKLTASANASWRITAKLTANTNASWRIRMPAPT